MPVDRTARGDADRRLASLGIPSDGRLIVLRRNAEDELLRHVAMMRVDFGARLDAWPTEQVREVLRSERYFQAVHLPGAFRIHPRNYALGLAAAAEQAGARIFEDTPALAMDSAGVRKRVDTPKRSDEKSRRTSAGSWKPNRLRHRRCTWASMARVCRCANRNWWTARANNPTGQPRRARSSL